MRVRTAARGLVAGMCMAWCAAGPAQSGPVVNPGNNPLLGSWVYSSGGFNGPGACAKTRSFAATSQTFEAYGKIQTRDVRAYAVEGTKVYVQERLGSGGTTAYVMVGRNEMMDTLGTGACHWKRQ